MYSSFKPTFNDPDTQSRFKKDTIESLASMSDERFMKYYFNRRLKFNDPDVVDAIWKEYVKRKDRFV